MPRPRLGRLGRLDGGAIRYKRLRWPRGIRQRSDKPRDSPWRKKSQERRRHLPLLFSSRPVTDNPSTSQKMRPSLVSVQRQRYNPREIGATRSTQISFSNEHVIRSAYLVNCCADRRFSFASLGPSVRGPVWLLAAELADGSMART